MAWPSLEAMKRLMLLDSLFSTTEAVRITFRSSIPSSFLGREALESLTRSTRRVRFSGAGDKVPQPQAPDLLKSPTVEAHGHSVRVLHLTAPNGDPEGPAKRAMVSGDWRSSRGKGPVVGRDKLSTGRVGGADSPTG